MGNVAIEIHRAVQRAISLHEEKYHQKDRKERVKEDKGNFRVKCRKTVFTPPTLLEVEQYIREKGYSVDAKTFLTYYSESNWVDSQGKKVKNWKQKVITWSGRAEPSGKKTKLLPIIGKICNIVPSCKFPAVHKDTSGNYDRFACAEHMPDEVKEKYV